MVKALIFILLFPTILVAQNTWSVDLPGLAPIRESVATYDGGVVVVTYQPNNIMKLDESGALVWSYVIDSGSLQMLFSLTETEDHGIVAFGNFADYSSTYVVKLDENGNKLWEKAYSTTAGGLTAQWACPAHGDGGFLFGGGECGLKFYATRCDANGSVMWTREYQWLAGQFGGYLDCMVQAADGGYFATFNNYVAPDLDWGLIKIDGSGAFEWAKVSDDVVYNNVVKATVATTTGGVAVLGVSYNTQLPNGAQQNMTLTTFDSAGNRLSHHVYDYPESIQPEGIIQTSDGGFILTGCVATTMRVLLVKTDSLGGIIWQKAGRGYAWQFGMGLAAARDEMFYLAGHDDVHWSFLNMMSVAGGDGFCAEDTVQLTVTSPATPILTATCSPWNGTVNAIPMADLSHTEMQQPTFLCTKVSNNPVVLTPPLVASPNPFTSTLNVEFGDALLTEGHLRIHDLQGRIVHEAIVASGISSLEMDIPHLPNGMLLLTLENEGIVRTLKLVHAGF
ncbi:MAG: T9SS type A sorting domain-containing protein [Bacteroidetes bacterium]|nr:T9SS type A sorting domain-containing protein [Bacteroidota bacterium]